MEELTLSFFHESMPGLIKCILIIYIGYVLASYSSKILYRFLNSRTPTKDIASFSQNLVYYLLIALAIMMGLAELGLDTSSLIALSGGMAIALGLGLRDQLSQLAAGIVLLVKKPFHVGDFITIAGQTGTVLFIDLFQTTIKATNNTKIVLPNSLAMNSIVTNFSSFETRRISLNVTIRHSDDIDQAKQALIHLAKSLEDVLADPEPIALSSDLKDNGHELTLRCWVHSVNYFSTLCLLREKAKKALQNASCDIAQPILNIYKA